MTEAAVERKLVEGVRKKGGWALKFVSPGTAGVPDRIVLMPGGFIIFVELKTDTGKLTKLQEITHLRLAGLGFPVRVVYGSEGVLAFLAELGGDPDAI